MFLGFLLFIATLVVVYDAYRVTTTGGAKLNLHSLTDLQRFSVYQSSKNTSLVSFFNFLHID